MNPPHNLHFLLATQNKGKALEIRRALSQFDIAFDTLEQYDSLPEAREIGCTFSENAHLKAIHYHTLTGMPVLAEDSGLVVDGLGGKPGIHSARFASTDKKRISRLLKMMNSFSDDTERTAYFVSAICVIFPSHSIEVIGKVNGLITRIPQGNQGFGYDPVFYYPPLGKTFSQITVEEKNRISHRAIALNKLLRKLECLPNTTTNQTEL
ncbi:MAG: RdgB/HAM1 family non-canonical purine NTP pyrophosphatase [Acidobacteriota bacterium]|nr:RdgB/HAM1 family non-canonical purine NTP pyrophosphatase [Acidobacteriota bacterium]